MNRKRFATLLVWLAIAAAVVWMASGFNLGGAAPDELDYNTEFLELVRRTETGASGEKIKAVLIDLGALFPNAPHFVGEYHPDGLQIRSVHLGVLTEWGRDEWGAWYGKVPYPIPAKDRQEKVTHWVPGWALRPAEDPPITRRPQSDGQVPGQNRDRPPRPDRHRHGG